MNHILLRSVKLNCTDFIPVFSQNISNGSQKIEMQPGSWWPCTNLHPNCPGGFQLYIYISFLPILWHHQSLQQLSQMWLRFQASRGWGKKKKRKKELVGFPMLNAVVKQPPKCCKCKQPGILPHLYNYEQTVELDQSYQDQKMWNLPLGRRQTQRRGRCRRRKDSVSKISWQFLSSWPVTLVSPCSSTTMIFNELHLPQLAR